MFDSIRCHLFLFKCAPWKKMTKKLELKKEVGMTFMNLRKKLS